MPPKEQKSLGSKEIMVVQPSPVPTWLAALVLLAVLGTVVSSVVFSIQRGNDVKATRDHFQTVTDDLARQQREADEDRTRLRALVEKLLLARTEKEAQEAFRQYLREQAAVDKRRREEAAARQQGEGGNPRPAPTPQASPTSTRPPRPTPSPTSTRTPTRTPTPSPTTNSPSPKPLVTCIDNTPLGRVCV